MAGPSKTNGKDSPTHPGFEAKLWLAADNRSKAETAEGNRSNNMDAAEPSGARQTASIPTFAPTASPLPSPFNDIPTKNRHARSL